MSATDQDLLSGAVIAFDLDGTLVETAPDLVGALNTVLAEQALPSLPLESARSLVGHGARALLVRGFQVAGLTLSDEAAVPLVARFIEVYHDRIADESRPYEGCLSALDTLRGHGAKLVVCTNKLTHLSTALLDRLNMTDRFEAVVGADSAPAPKPDPRHVLHAVSAAGGTPDRAIMVGDSLNDVASAKAAGVPAIVFPFGYTDIPAAELGADRLIHHYDQLVGAARELLGRR